VDNGMKIKNMEYLREKNLIAAIGDSTKMVRKKVTTYIKTNMEEKTIANSRMISEMVTEF
jgi:hypothetical protein